jgi:hypothetical protein
LLLDEVSDIDM